MGSHREDAFEPVRCTQHDSWLINRYRLPNDLNLQPASFITYISHSPGKSSPPPELIAEVERAYSRLSLWSELASGLKREVSMTRSRLFQSISLKRQFRPNLVSSRQTCEAHREGRRQGEATQASEVRATDDALVAEAQHASFRCGSSWLLRRSTNVRPAAAHQRRQACNCRRGLWSCNSPLGAKSFTARVCSTAMPKSPREEFKRVRMQLQARTLIGVNGELVWKA